MNLGVNSILNRTMNDRQFKQYLKQLLKEEGGDSGMAGGGSGFGFGDMGGMGGMGGMYSMGSTEGLYNTFVKPFVEVIQTTSGVTKEFMRRVSTTVSVAFEVVLTTFIPVIRDSYDEIFENERRDIEALREKYKAIYASNEEMFYHSDMNVLAFSISPVNYFTGIFFRKSPKAAQKAFEIVTGDNSTVKYWFKRLSMLHDFTGSDRDWQKAEWQYNLQRRRFDDDAIRGGQRKRGESVEARPVITEGDQSWKKDAYKELINDMMNDQQVIDAIEKSSVVRGMHDDAVKIVKKFHHAVKVEADSANDIKDFNSLKSYVKATGNSKAIDSLNKFENAIKQPQKQQQEEKPTNTVQTEGSQLTPETIVPKFVTQVKRAIKGIFGSGIASQIKAAKQAGMSDDSEIVQLLSQAKRDVENLNG